MNYLAPIILFVYNRPWHTRQTVEALQKNEQANDSKLFIFSDEAKDEMDTKPVNDVRDYIRTIDGFKNVEIIERDKNFGLSNSVISGVTEVINKYGKVIVLEDDLVTSPYFLNYMNDALTFYEKEDRVVSMMGYCYPVKEKLPETYFLRGAECWGWATWKRGWDSFEKDGQVLLDELKRRHLIKPFNLNGNFNYTQMLRDQVGKKNDSWAIRWQASTFLKNQLTLYPGESLVKNIGFDQSGIHCGPESVFDTKIIQKRIRVQMIPLEESYIAVKEVELFFKSIKSNFFRRIYSKGISLGSHLLKNIKGSAL